MLGKRKYKDYKVILKTMLESQIDGKDHNKVGCHLFLVAKIDQLY